MQHLLMRQYVAKPGQECKSELIVGAKFWRLVVTSMNSVQPKKILISEKAKKKSNQRLYIWMRGVSKYL